MLKAQNISKIYEGRMRCTALAETSLTLGDVGLVLITGESGSGKTTLLNLLSGLDTPTSGSVTTDYGGAYAAFVFSDGHLLENFTLAENLHFAMSLAGVARSDSDELINKYELSEVADHKPNELSAGQAQRAAILRAVLMDRPVIFADEPTSDLDGENAKKVAELLKEESARRLVVVVSHNGELFSAIADRHIVMSHGSVISDTGEADGHDSHAPAVCCAQPRLTMKNALILSARSARRSAKRIVATSVALLLCMALIVLSVNMLLTDPFKSRYVAAKNDNAVTFDVGKCDVDHDEWGGATHFTEPDLGELSLLAEDYGGVMYRDNDWSQMTSEETFRTSSVNRFYLSDECFMPVIAGDASLSSGEVALSDDSVRDLFGDEPASDAIGRVVTSGGSSLTISCVYADDTSAASWRVLDEGVGGSEDIAGCIVTAETFEALCLDAVNADDTLGNTAYGNVFVSSEHSSGTYVALLPYENEAFAERIVSGEPGTYENGIMLSESYAEQLFDDAESVIGRGLTLTFTNDFGRTLTRTYTVEGLFTSRDAIALPRSGRAGVVPDFAWNMCGSGRTYGLSLPGYTLGALRELHEAGYCADMYLNDAHAEQLRLTMFVGMFLAAAAVLMLVVGVILILLFVGEVVSRSRHDMGVLRALGLQKRSIIRSLILQPAIVLASAVIVTAALHPLALLLVGGVTGAATRGLMLLYYFFPALLIVAGVAVLLTLMSVALTYRRSSRLSVIDIIYHRK